MESLSEIKKSIQKMSSVNRKSVIFTAKVERVDGEVCEVTYEGMRLTDVRLRAVVNGEESGVMLTPKVGSYVTVADLGGDMTQLVVIAFSEVDSVDVTTVGEIHLNGDSFGGLVKIQELVGDLRNIVTIFNSHTHAVAGNVTAFPSLSMNNIDAGALENKRIKHGDR